MGGGYAAQGTMCYIRAWIPHVKGHFSGDILECDSNRAAQSDVYCLPLFPCHLVIDTFR